MNEAYITTVDGECFVVVPTCEGKKARIRLSEIAVLIDEGEKCGIVTKTGFMVAVPLKDDSVWRVMNEHGTDT